MLEFKTINQFQREENETQNNFQNYTETLQRQWLAYTNIRVSFELRFADRNIYIQSTGFFFFIKIVKKKEDNDRLLKK